MIFNSTVFLVFLPIVFIVYWSLSGKKVSVQNTFVLAASYFFYGWWDWRFLFLILFSTTVDFFAGIKIDQSTDKRQKRLYLLVSLFTNIGLLAFFKYYNFFVASLEEAIGSVGLEIDTWTLNIILPVGISFYTFQTLSYTIDVYKGKLKPARDFIGFASFVSFFPQLVAGPIERASNLLPQFYAARKFDSSVAINGFTLIVYGLFKKVVIADRLAIYVNQVFADIDNANTISLVIGVVFFSVQIYCDFSGYSLIARGVAKLLGFELMVNFRRPYLATSIPDFWRRWHISLSTWFKDYVYIPLGGNRVSTLRNYSNLMIVFLVSGLWHGANWTFIIWGGLHGMFQVVYLFYKKRYSSSRPHSILSSLLSTLLVYGLVCFAWIFFRASSISEASQYISKIAELDFSFNLVQLCAEKGPLNLLLSFGAIGLLALTYRLPENLVFERKMHYVILNVALLLIITFIGVNGESEFIYFQF